MKAQYPSLYIPADKLDGSGGTDDASDLPDDVKPLSEASSVMEVSRLVTHLTRAVAAARERVSTLVQELHPLKEKMVLLNDECDEKKKVRAIFVNSPVNRTSEFHIFPLSHITVSAIHFVRQAYNALQTTLNAECALTQSEINETENAVRELEQNWNHLQVNCCVRV